MTDVHRLDHDELDRAERLLDDLGARRTHAECADDPMLRALEAWVASIDVRPGDAPCLGRSQPTATVLALPSRRAGRHRTTRRVVIGSVLAAVAVAGTSVAAAVTGTHVPLLTAVGTVLMDVVPDDRAPQPPQTLGTPPPLVPSGVGVAGQDPAAVIVPAAASGVHEVVPASFVKPAGVPTLTRTEIADDVEQPRPVQESAAAPSSAPVPEAAPPPEPALTPEPAPAPWVVPPSEEVLTWQPAAEASRAGEASERVSARSDGQGRRPAVPRPQPAVPVVVEVRVSEAAPDPAAAAVRPVGTPGRSPAVLPPSAVGPKDTGTTEEAGRPVKAPEADVSTAARPGPTPPGRPEKPVTPPARPDEPVTPPARPEKPVTPVDGDGVQQPPAPPERPTPAPVPPEGPGPAGVDLPPLPPGPVDGPAQVTVPQEPEPEPEPAPTPSPSGSPSPRP